MVKCVLCNQDFAKQRDLLLHRHQKHSELPDQSFRCGHCQTVFTLAKNLVRHLKKVHKFDRSVRCTCQTCFGQQEAWQKHCTEEQSLTAPCVRTNPARFCQNYNFLLERERKAIREHFQSFRLKLSGDSSFDPFEFLVTKENDIIDFINRKLEDLVLIKFGMCIEVRFVKPLTDDSTVCFFHSPMEILTSFNGRRIFFTRR